MQIKSIQLTNFNNYLNVQTDFHTQVNALTGKNGMGKTNMLDAIYYLCIGKSYFSSGDKYVVKKGESFFRCFGTFENKSGIEEVEIKVAPGKKRKLFYQERKEKDFPIILGSFLV